MKGMGRGNWWGNIELQGGEGGGANFIHPCMIMMYFGIQTIS